MNQNKIKMYQAQGEFEQSLNSIRQSQNELIKHHIRTQEWYLFDKGRGGSTGKPKPLSLNSHPIMLAISSNLSISRPQNTKEEKNWLSLNIPPSLSILLIHYKPFIVILLSISSF